MLVITKEQKAVFTQALLLRRIRKYLLKNIPEIHKNIPEEKFDIFIKKNLLAKQNILAFEMNKVWLSGLT